MIIEITKQEIESLKVCIIEYIQQGKDYFITTENDKITLSLDRVYNKLNKLECKYDEKDY